MATCNLIGEVIFKPWFRFCTKHIALVPVAYAAIKLTSWKIIPNAWLYRVEITTQSNKHQ